MDSPERHHRTIDKVPFDAIGFRDVTNPITLTDACHVQTPGQRCDDVERFRCREGFPFAADLVGECIDLWTMLELILKQIKDASRCLHNEKWPLRFGL